jgi:hypothetical protein
MGNCDCLNNDYYIFEDENFSSIKINENTKNNYINKINRFNNNKNEYIFIPDKNISLEKQLNNELLKNKYNLNLIMNEKDIKKSKEILVNLYQSLKIRKLDEVNYYYIIQNN